MYALCKRSSVDNSAGDRQTTAFAGNRILASSPRTGFPAFGPSRPYTRTHFVHGHDRATGLLYPRLLTGDDR
jgi:hypothetical protein